VRKIVIIGANSAIAAAAARLLAAEGHALYLAARNTAALQSLVDDLEVRGAQNVHSGPFDATNTVAHTALIDAATAALGGLDTAILAYGSLPDQAAVQDRPEDVLAELATNFTSAASLLTIIASRFERQGKGTIVGISSVAGDRGRAANYVYGSAKAGLTCFLSGMRQRLWRKGVHVITVKPGFVDTPMTAAFPKGPLWAKPEAVAAGIVRAMKNSRSTVYLPSFWRLIMTIIALLPERVFLRMRF
jgi:decaprenylphospho-beta-D-erythro-pentofuranosid-2-ulose 2-reductase